MRIGGHISEVPGRNKSCYQVDKLEECLLKGHTYCPNGAGHSERLGEAFSDPVVHMKWWEVGKAEWCLQG